MPILKPESCRGCPFYSKSKYITPDFIVPNSRITILAQNPGQHEEEGSFLEKTEYVYGKKQEITHQVTPQPLIGASGNWLRREFWPLTELDYSDVSRANVIKCRPFNSNELPNVASNKMINGISVKELKEAVAFCSDTHLHLPDTTRYILAMGELSFYALTGEKVLSYKREIVEETLDESDEIDKKTQRKSTITEWRGWCLGVDLVEHTILGLYDYYDCSKAGSSLWPRMVNVFPVIHPAALYRNDTFYHATLLDFERFGKLVRGEWPRELPEFTVNVIPAQIPEIIGFDTEYTQEKILTMWSMADVESNIYVIDAEYSRVLSHLPSQLTLVTQNGHVDLPYLLPLVPADYIQQIRVEDCMYAHATLWPGEYHSLDYQLSKYGEYNRHKHLRETVNQDLRYMYSALDAHTTLNSAWKAHVKHFKRDRLLWLEYERRRRPLIPIISRFTERGIKVWQERVDLVGELLDKEMERIQAEVRELTGVDDFNIRSNDQVGKFLHGKL
jgi:uracil-DNA glycosylase